MGGNLKFENSDFSQDYCNMESTRSKGKQGFTQPWKGARRWKTAMRRQS